MEPFLGQLTLFPFNFAPKGWALCEGQLLPIEQNTALFSLLGTYFGGDGKTTFALPDLRGRVPNGQGQAPGLQPYTIGEAAGAEAVQLTESTASAHTHPFYGLAGQATANSPAGTLPAEPVAGGRGGSSPVNLYAASGQPATLAASQVDQVSGGGQPHNNMQPYLVLSWCIALQGIYPSRS